MSDQFTRELLYQLHPQKVRELIREGRIRQPTAGISAGFAQGNLVVLPKVHAYDFLLYTQRNSKMCPVIEVSDAGSREFKRSAKGSDIARDIPRYCLYRDGILEGEVESVEKYWRDDLISFLLGSGISYEMALMDAGIDVRHLDDGLNAPIYITNQSTQSAGIFSGPMLVSMLPIPRRKLVKAVTVTSALTDIYGAPVHIGDPSMLGITDLFNPDFGDPTLLRPDEVPVFWSCGITPQYAAMSAKLDFVITHAPGHMFITDIKNGDLFA